MQRRIYSLLAGLVFLTTVTAFGQRQELSISPIGFLPIKNQLIQYERYVDSRQSLTLSLGYIGDHRYYTVLKPSRMDHFWNTRGAIGYRYYFHSVFNDEVVMLFGSIRTVVDYSNLQLASDANFSIPADSLRASGVSLAPELLMGGKITIARRITLTGAVGGQHLFKLFSTEQITRNPDYWRKVNSEDEENWQLNRNVITNFRRGWYPSVQITVGVVLGKRRQVQ
ncbi:hypothetical protein [Spirosoma sp.]|uniref:hypothetical protein n=1 Tax=Spirosoma sp. TaxID=1899569 RepID=UPI003B3B0110